MDGGGMGESPNETVREFSVGRGSGEELVSSFGSSLSLISPSMPPSTSSDLGSSSLLGGLPRGGGLSLQGGGLRLTSRSFSSGGGDDLEPNVEVGVGGGVDDEIGGVEEEGEFTQDEDDASGGIAPGSSSTQSDPSCEPLANIDPSALRYKIKKYERMALPPYHHPNEFKVVLEVYVKDLNLSENGLEALIDIVGPRYNANKQLLKLTCNKFDTRVENRNYLVWLLDSLLQEAEKFHST